MTLPVDGVHVSRGLDLVDESLSDGMFADQIVSCDEEGHRKLSDLRDVDEGGLLGAGQPLVIELLEAVNETVHQPVLLGLDTLALGAGSVLEVLADSEAVDILDLLKVGSPVGTVDGVNAIVTEGHDGGVSLGLHEIGDVRNEARSHVDDLVQVVNVVGLFVLSESVVHLSGTLRVTDVEDLVLSGGGLDHVDVGGVVIEAHVGPGPVPVLGIDGGVEGLVAPTVHGTTVVANPDVVAGVNELQGEGLLVLVGIVSDPGGTIFHVTVLDEDAALGGLLGLSSLVGDVESGEDEVVLGGDLNGLPIVTHFAHNIGESGVSSSIRCLLGGECHRGGGKELSNHLFFISIYYKRVYTPYSFLIYKA